MLDMNIAHDLYLVLFWFSVVGNIFCLSNLLIQMDEISACSFGDTNSSGRAKGCFPTHLATNTRAIGSSICGEHSNAPHLPQVADKFSDSQGSTCTSSQTHLCKTLAVCLSFLGRGVGRRKGNEEEEGESIKWTSKKNSFALKETRNAETLLWWTSAGWEHGLRPRAPCCTTVQFWVACWDELEKDKLDSPPYKPRVKSVYLKRSEVRLKREGISRVSKLPLCPYILRALFINSSAGCWEELMNNGISMATKTSTTWTLSSGGCQTGKQVGGVSSDVGTLRRQWWGTLQSCLPGSWFFRPFCSMDPFGNWWDLSPHAFSFKQMINKIYMKCDNR